MAGFRALIALVVCVFVAQPAIAQTLQRLTVTSLTLSSNVNGPHVEVPFDLIVTAHVRERIAELRNLDLPVLTDVEVLGDSHTLVADGNGTTYTEHIRVVAHHSGTITIDPVTLDAVDARDGKPKRYSSNALTLTIGGGISAMSAPVDITAPVFNVLRWLVAIVVVLLIVRIYARRKTNHDVPAPAPVPLAPQPAMPQRVPSREERLRDARILLAAQRDRPTVMQIRSLVRGMVGASDAETLADVLKATQAKEPVMQRLLVALERAAFTHDDDLQPAVDSVLAALEAAA